MRIPDYDAMTDTELADDLDRWADVRDGLDKQVKEGTRDRKPLGSGNLREAAHRLRYAGKSCPKERSDMTKKAKMWATLDLFVLLVGSLLLVIMLPAIGVYFWGIPGFAVGLVVGLLVVAVDFQRWMARHYSLEP